MADILEPPPSHHDDDGVTVVIPEGLNDDVSMTSATSFPLPNTTTSISSLTNHHHHHHPITPLADSDADSVEDNLSDVVVGVPPGNTTTITAGGRDGNGVNNDNDDVEDDDEEDDDEVNPARLDEAEREMYEKYKQQEREEREEIERELQAHKLELFKHQEELRLREKELQQTQDFCQQKAGSGGGAAAAAGGGHHSPGSSGGVSSRPSSSSGGGGGGGGGGGNSSSSNGGGGGGGNERGHGLSLNLSSAAAHSLNGIGLGLAGLGGGGGGMLGPHHPSSRLSAEELRAHVQAAQLAALGQFSSVLSPHHPHHHHPHHPHHPLGPQFSPRDALNGLHHPLRAAGLLPPTPHGPFVGGGNGGAVPPLPPLPPAPTTPGLLSGSSDKFGPRPPSSQANHNNNNSSNNNSSNNNNNSNSSSSNNNNNNNGNNNNNNNNSGLPSSQRSSPDPTGNGDSRSHHWTFEEQFKQLYELSDDQQRKEFLDDLFAFMQKRGSPVNRIPIMAKQTLDLYELFRLVVSKGGLVEVINKKLWREITKGLNLPSSITSAAFTLRTQYMKYLYPYECEKLKLSNPSELQAAIDGNRREGRRSSYGYDLSPGPTLVPSTHPLNGSLLNGKMGRGSPGTEQWTNGLCAAEFWGRPQGMETWRAASPVLDLSNKTSVSVSAAAAAAAWAVAAHNSRVPPHPLSHHPHPAALPPGLPMLDLKPNPQIDDDDNSLPPTPQTPAAPTRLTERDALAMEAASRAMEEATRKMEAASHHPRPSSGGGPLGSGGDSNHGGSPPRKRALLSEDDRLLAHSTGIPSSAHLKITSRNDGRSEVDGSLVVTMEVNGIMYQGVLFAANHPSRRM